MLKKNDSVKVIAGKEKGKVAKILQLDLEAGRVILEKVNMGKRHTKPTQNSAGGIVEKELPLHISNVQLFCGTCNRGVRSKLLITDQKNKQGKMRSVKVRACKRCGKSLDHA